LGVYPDNFAFSVITTIYTDTEQSPAATAPATMAFDDILDYDSDTDALMIADGKFIILFGPQTIFIIWSPDFR